MIVQRCHIFKSFKLCSSHIAILRSAEEILIQIAWLLPLGKVPLLDPRLAFDAWHHHYNHMQRYAKILEFCLTSKLSKHTWMLQPFLESSANSPQKVLQSLRNPALFVGMTNGLWSDPGWASLTVWWFGGTNAILWRWPEKSQVEWQRPWECTISTRHLSGSIKIQQGCVAKMG